MRGSVIKYNYHDSYIDEVEVNADRIIFSVVLYSLYYPDSPKVTVELSGIYNQKNVENYFKSILAESEDGEIGCQVEAMFLDEKKESADGNFYIYLKTDWEGAIRIHCSKFNEHLG